MGVHLSIVCSMMLFCVTGCYGNKRKTTCPMPLIDNGFIVGRDREFEADDVAKIQCHDGYILEGNSRLRCTEQGTWADTLPHCEEIRCGKLPDLVNGRIYPDQPVLAGHYAYMSCNKKFVLLGPKILQCREDGAWEPYEIMFCKELRCPDLPQFKNGLVQPSERTRPGKVEFSCDRGFVLNGPSSLTCRSDGEWIPNVMPFCRRTRCPNLPRLPNGEIYTTGSTSSRYSATSVCDPGYILKGPEKMICPTNGTWEPHEMVHCIEETLGGVNHMIIYLIVFPTLAVIIALLTFIVFKLRRRRGRYRNLPESENTCDRVTLDDVETESSEV